MKNSVTIGLFAIALIFMSTRLSEDQQPKPTKFGYLDSAELLSIMPAVKQAKAKLEAQSKQSQKLLETEAQKFQAKYAQALQDAQEGKLTEADQTRIQQELAVMQENLVKKERQMTDDLVKKEEALFKPIQAQVRTAIKTVAKEKGYRFIFDSSGGILLHSEPTDNVMGLVKAKLGIK